MRVEYTDLGDHYDPEARAVRLSAANYEGRSLTAVTVAAHGLQVVAGFGRAERLAQSSDVNIDRALLQVCIRAPDVIEDLRAVYDANRLKPVFFQSAAETRETGEAQFEIVVTLMLAMAILAAPAAFGFRDVRRGAWPDHPDGDGFLWWDGGAHLTTAAHRLFARAARDSLADAL
mgnify:CR=1 FL=1